MEMILARYDVELRRVNKTYLRGRCPLPTHGTGASDTSLGVQTEKNAWACQSASCVAARGGRKGGNVLDFVAAMESCTVRDAALKLQGWFMGEGAEASNGHVATSPALATGETPTGNGASGGVLVNKPLPFALKGVDSSHPYLTRRGITRETAEHFGVGFFPGKGSMSGRIVIPIHNAEGELVAYAGRALDEATEPRYKLPAGFDRSRELFNLHCAAQADSRGVVIVVRGFFDAMKVHQAGFPSVIALMGPSLSDVQAELLGAFDRVLLMLAGGESGAEAPPNVAARLAAQCFIRVIGLPDGKQPNLLSSNNIRRILNPLY